MPKLTNKKNGNIPGLIWFSSLSFPVKLTVLTLILLTIATGWLMRSGTVSFFSDARHIQPTPTPPNVANIAVSPTSGSTNINVPFTVAIKVNGAGVAFNAAQATVAVSPNFTVQSLTPGDCNFSYVKSPSTTDLSFTGAILGGTSISCTVYTATLLPVSRGTGTVTLSNGSIKSSVDNSEMIGTMINGSYSIRK